MVNFTAFIVVRVYSFESVYQDNWLDSKMSFLQEWSPLYSYLSIRYVIQKLGWDVKSIVFKVPNDQTISLKIINEKRVTLPVKYIAENWF